MQLPRITPGLRPGAWTRLAASLVAAAASPASAAGPEAAPTPPASQAAAPDFSTSKQSVRVPFARPVDFDKLTAMRVRVSLNGGPPTTFLVDTGSVGVIVSAKEVPNIDPNAPPGSITYSSSGISLEGVWTPVTIAFLDAKDEHGKPPTAVVPVLAAKERKVAPGAVNGGKAKGSTDPKVYMFGIGFGRGKESHPERNPFVNLKEMQAATMRRGYTITRDGFTLGLTPAVAKPDFLYQKLKERTVSPETTAMKPGLKDWESPRGSVTINGEAGPEGTVLLDTGLTNMMVGKVGLPEQTDVSDGAPVTVNLMDGRLHYDFQVGDAANPTTPRRVTLLKRTEGATLNTGLKAFAAFDYLYDAEGGYLGLRPTAKDR
ncbi:MAG: hypothetical protein JWO31_2548 [Phycisphaerales bacterium]|nr:hypothetical protein [Phycisphaerales bacterium]